ncbi:hypothetical protein Q6348_08385 [Isoptericola sp. b441]|uniref:Type I restriction modification DNA specificity domain-containing protein n=1 Tax=Actinotalea lenta TaxID=3064654 RepID=A0ABT9D9P4_9CELL|nr:hypothetical protein [Isoptericola sp. b441]MDO8107211.1 hypothetical protein [Isoptericola sp. b441]
MTGTAPRWGSRAAANGRFGHLVARTDVRLPGVDLPLLSVSQTRGVVRRSEISDAPPRADSLDAYKVCRKHDIVFNKMSIGAGAVGVAQEDGLVTYHYEVMRAFADSDPRFVTMLMKSDWFIGELVARERGIGAGPKANVRTTEVPFSVMRAVPIWVPTLDEQRAIADYLDEQTAKIDALIAKQNEMIGLLDERRVAAITHVVQRDGQSLTRLGHLADVIDCAHVTAEFVDDDSGYPVASIGQCQGPEVDLSQAPRTTAEFFRLLTFGDRAPQAGDLLFIRNVSVGLASEVPAEVEPFAVGQETVLIRPSRSILTRFVRYGLQSSPTKFAIESAMVGSTFRRINVSRIRALPVPLIPASEQIAVVDRLDSETAQIDALVTRAREHIALAQERRAALITAAVTGQIDVRTATREVMA